MIILETRIFWNIEIQQFGLEQNWSPNENKMLKTWTFCKQSNTYIMLCLVSNLWQWYLELLKLPNLDYKVCDLMKTEGKTLGFVEWQDMDTIYCF